jgi:AcrR family transcriptional regulator
MPTSPRRDRARAERRDLIVQTARTLAESEGWDHVTTRRLAEQVDYSQPVLYAHFKNMDAIAGAVALQGFEELAVALREGREADGLRGVALAYLAYAAAHPAVYEAMFTRPTDLTFGAEDTIELLKSTFDEIQHAVAPNAAGDLETQTELFWASLHGLATLTAGARLRPSHTDERVEALISLLTGRS